MRWILFCAAVPGRTPDFTAVAALFCLAVAGWDLIRLIRFRRKIMAVEAVVLDVTYAARRIPGRRTGTGSGIGSGGPAGANAAINPGKNNSAWARVSYRVDGRTCTPDRRIQVPLSTRSGSRIKIRCQSGEPYTPVSFSWQRSGLFFAAAALLFFLGSQL